jgi:hypothetical protein
MYVCIHTHSLTLTHTYACKTHNMEYFSELVRGSKEASVWCDPSQCGATPLSLVPHLYHPQAQILKSTLDSGL